MLNKYSNAYINFNFTLIWKNVNFELKKLSFLNLLYSRIMC